MLTLLLATADATVVHAIAQVDGPEVELVHAWLAPGEREARPGDLAVLDVDGTVILTSELPPLATHRAVVTPEGHDSAPWPSRYVRLTLPWPDGATAIRAGDKVISPSLRAGEPQPGPGVERLRGEGPTSRRLDLVLLSEGYTAAQQAEFEADARVMLAQLDTMEPYATYGHLIDVWTAFVPSPQAGIDPTQPVFPPGQAPTDPPTPTGSVDTPFECFYGCAGIGRLICCDEQRIVNKLIEVAGFFDGVLLLTNSDVYGGSGGEIYSVSYTGDQGAIVGSHELSHSLVLLWDEYSYGTEGDPALFTSRNCAPEGQPPPWQHWMDADHPEIGVFPSCSFTNWVRPTAGNCLMNSLQEGFCPVCRELVVREVYRQLGHDFTTSVDPPDDKPTRIREGETQQFRVTAIEPAGGLTWEWTLDGELMSTEPGSFELGGCGNLDSELMLTLRDDTEWVRADPSSDLVSVVRWRVKTDRCEGDPADACGCRTVGAGHAAALALGALAAARRRRWSR